MSSTRTKGESCYRAAASNVRRASSPDWKRVAEQHKIKHSTAIGLARKWALTNNERHPDKAVQWPLKAKQRNELRYREGQKLYEQIVDDPTVPIKSLGGRRAERALYYFVHTDGPKPDEFLWPIPGRDKGAASGRARGGGINRLELGGQVYEALKGDPTRTLREVAETLDVSRNKANNDLALFVKVSKANGGIEWPIPGRRSPTPGSSGGRGTVPSAAEPGLHGQGGRGHHGPDPEPGQER